MARARGRTAAGMRARRMTPGQFAQANRQRDRGSAGMAGGRGGKLKPVYEQGRRVNAANAGRGNTLGPRGGMSRNMQNAARFVKRATREYGSGDDR